MLLHLHAGATGYRRCNYACIRSSRELVGRSVAADPECLNPTEAINEQFFRMGAYTAKNEIGVGYKTQDVDIVNHCLRSLGFEHNVEHGAGIAFNRRAAG